MPSARSSWSGVLTGDSDAAALYTKLIPRILQDIEESANACHVAHCKRCQGLNSDAAAMTVEQQFDPVLSAQQYHAARAWGVFQCLRFFYEMGMYKHPNISLLYPQVLA